MVNSTEQNHELKGEAEGISLEGKNVIPVEILKVERKPATTTQDENFFVKIAVKLPSVTNPERDSVIDKARSLRIGNAFIVQGGL